MTVEYAGVDHIDSPDEQGGPIRHRAGLESLRGRSNKHENQGLSATCIQSANTSTSLTTHYLHYF
jgi:hypothetical protein